MWEEDGNSISDKSWDTFWEYLPETFNLIKNGDSGLPSLFIHILDNYIDSELGNEVNGDYEGSLYFQKYTNQVQEYKGIDKILTGASLVPKKEISITSTIFGFLHNFDKRDGQIVSSNITGFIKGAQQEISRIDDILSNSNDENFNNFLAIQKNKLNQEINYNTNYYFSNYVFSTFNGKIIEVDKNQYINKATPLPGIDYLDPIYRLKE